MRHRHWLAGLLLGFSLLNAGCSLSERPQPATLSGVAYFSMPWQVKVTDLPEGLTAAQLQMQLQQRLDAANSVLSTYQPDTELMRFNRAPTATWVPLSPLLQRAVSRALQVSAATAGAYDITVAPLVNLWGFGPQARPERMPSTDEIAAARRQVGWQHLELDATGQRLRKQAAVSMDLSSVGEGAAVDDLAGYLETLGIHDYLVAVAGSLRSKGLRPDGQPWRMAIERPDGSGAAEQVLNLKAGAISTSGSYRNYFERDGVRYSHTIDPATGRPITHRGVSVTVVSPTGDDDTLADAWATALNVLGPERGLALAQQRGMAVYYIERTEAGFQARYSQAFKPYLAK